jgi:hypothetical protein
MLVCFIDFLDYEKNKKWLTLGLYKPGPGYIFATYSTSDKKKTLSLLMVKF